MKKVAEAYDGTITLGVKLTPTDVKKTAEALKKELDSVINNPSSGKGTSDQISKIEARMKQLSDMLDKYLEKAKQLENTGTSANPAEDKYRASLEKKLEALEKELELLKAIKDQQQQKPTTDANNEALANTQKQIDALKKSIADTQAALQQLTNGSQQSQQSGGQVDIAQYQQLIAQINALNNEVIQLRSAYRSLLPTQQQSTGEVKKSTMYAYRLGQAVGAILRTLKKIGVVIGRTLINGAKKLVGHFSKIRHHSDAHNNSLKRTLKTILMYSAGVASIMTLWNKLRNYAKEAIKSMAQVFDDVNEDVSMLMNSFNQLKLSIGTMVQPLLHALAPALNYIIQLVTSAVNALANFFAILTGQKFVYKATKQNQKYGESIGGVGSAAKEANKELAEYDNLLVINSQDDSGGGGGGGTGSGDLAGQFEKVVAKSDFAEALKEAIKKGDWEGVGGLFANKLNIITKAFDNWVNTKFRPTAKKWSKNIADAFNGFLDEWDADLTGKTIGDVLMAIFDTSATFFETFHWKKLGTKVADAIDGIFTSWEPETVARDVAGKFNAVIDFVGGLVDPEEGIDFENIGAKLGETLKKTIEGIHWKDLGINLTNLASGLMRGLSKFIKESKLGVTVGNAINDFLSGIDFGKLARDMSDLAVNILNALADCIKTINWKQVGQAIADFLKNIKWLDLIESLIDVATSLIEGLAEALWQIVTDPAALGSLALALGAIFGAKSIWNGIKSIFSSNTSSAISDGVGALSEDSGFMGSLGNKFAKIFGYAVAGYETYQAVGGAMGNLFADIIGDSDEELSNEYRKFAKDPVKYTKEAAKEVYGAIGETSEATGSTTLSNAVDAMFSGAGNSDIDKAMEREKKKATDSIKESAKLMRQGETGVEYTDDEWDVIFYGEALGRYKQNFGELEDTITKGGSNVLGLLDNIVNGIGDATEEIADGSIEIMEDVGTVTDYIPPAVKEAMEEAQKNTAPVTQYMPQEVKDAMYKVEHSFDFTDYLPASVKEDMEKAATNMVEPFDEVPTELGTTSQSALQSIASPFDQTKEIFENRASDMVGAFDSVPTDLGNTSQSALESVKNNFTQDALTGHFTSVKDNIETPFKELPSFFSDTFKESWNEAEAAFSDGNTTFNNFNSKLSEGMSNAINGLIDGLNGAVSSPLRKIQEIIEKFKNVKVGTNSLFSNLPSFSNIPSIPHLAQGAVIPPNREFMAMLGDQTSGTNIETPLATMVQAFKTALSEMGGSSNNQNIVLQLDGRTVAQCVWDEEDKRYKQTGRR